ncbi:MAG: hypothetical protein EBX40_01340 [Gammaproteobacteria bacterium]|nr:hypothetical protein [Gammaproteobacteria bacterium]
MMHNSFYSFSFGLLLFSLAQVFLMLSLYKLIAIYGRGRWFLLSIAGFYVLNRFGASWLVGWMPSAQSLSQLSHLSFAVLVGAIALLVAFYFGLPKLAVEEAQYRMEKLRDILKPVVSVQAWLLILLMAASGIFISETFPLLTRVCLGGILGFDAQDFLNAIRVFDVSVALGYLLYAIFFYDHARKSAVIAISLGLALLCFLGVGYLSMSSILIWTLIALAGIFLGSSVLLFALLLNRVRPAAFAFALSLSIMASLFFHQFEMNSFSFYFGHPSTVAALKMLWLRGILELGFIGALVLLVRPAVTESASSLPHPHVFSALKQYWKGQASLGSAFWLLFVLGVGAIFMSSVVVLLNILLPWLLPMMSTHVQAKTLLHDMEHHFGLVFMLFSLVLAVSTVFTFMVVWKCSRASKRFVRYTARFITLGSALGALLYLGISVIGLIWI